MVALVRTSNHTTDQTKRGIDAQTQFFKANLDVYRYECSTRLALANLNVLQLALATTPFATMVKV